MNRMRFVTLRLCLRFLRLVSFRLLMRMAWRSGIRNVMAIRKFKKRLKKGKVFPPFLFISITSRCNLRCRGCWVNVEATPPGELSPKDVSRIIEESKPMGSKFFGLLGGEPFCHPEMREILASNRDCFFQVFTNGKTLDASVAKWLKEIGNVTPLISIEGNADESDRRRGGTAVLDSSRSALAACVNEGLPTGVATSLCRSNIDHMLTEEFIDEMIERKASYLWYYIYRPVGGDPCPEESLTREQILRARKFIVEMRTKKPIMIVDSYWDHKGRALCPAAVGISHHIGPWGDIEPCPPIQFAKENIADGNVVDLITNSEFLESFRKYAASKTRGCILLDDPEAFVKFIEESQAMPTSRRPGLEEIAKLTRLPSHDLGDDAIPEKNLFYRMAKKMWFFGFGAYG